MLRYRLADYETTSLQDYKWLSPWAQLSLGRLQDNEWLPPVLRYRFADY